MIQRFACVENHMEMHIEECPTGEYMLVEDLPIGALRLAISMMEKHTDYYDEFPPHGPLFLRIAALKHLVAVATFQKPKRRRK